MVKVFIGSDISLIGQEVKKAIRKEAGELDSLSYFTFDMYNDLIQDAVEEAENVSFFSGKKYIVITNCYFLSSDMAPAPRQLDAKQDYKAFISYLEHPNPDSDVFLLSQGKMAGERGNDLMKALHKYGDITVIEPERSDSLAQKGLHYVGGKGADISMDALVELINRTDNSYSGMINGLDKLLCYTSKIRMEDVDDLVAPKLEDSVFSVVGNLMKSNSRGAIKSYRDLRRQGKDPIGLIPVFTSQLRTMYLVAYLAKKGKNDLDIGRDLALSPIRVKYTRKDIGSLTPSAIMGMMAELGRIEDHIKFDLDDPDLLLEFFFINFKRKYLKRA